jgi:hypothetical protein
VETRDTVAELLLDVLESLFVDDSVTLDLRVREPGCMQQSNDTFEDKTMSNQTLYLSHFVRAPLTASIYVGRFMPTHRVRCSGPMFMGALENALRGLGIKRGTSAFEALPLDFVCDVVRSIDREEAQFRAAQAVVLKSLLCPRDRHACLHVAAQHKPMLVRRTQTYKSSPLR